MTGLTDYWRMFKGRGAGRVWHHLKDVAFFDLWHGTDTDTWLPLSSYKDRMQNYSEAVHYQPSFTSEIKESFDFLQRQLGDLSRYDFYDLGSGKGKVCFIARGYKFRSINGIEFYEPLCAIARKNAERFKDPRISFHCADVTQFSFPEGPLIFFAYNPFSAHIWKQVLDAVAEQNYIVIYNNPVHAEIYADKDVWFADTDSKWENKRTVIFANFRKPG